MSRHSAEASSRRQYCRKKVGETSWGTTLDLVTHEFGIAGAGLVPLQGSQMVLGSSSEFSDAVNAYADGGWDKHDIRYKGVQAAMRRGGIGTDWDVISEAQMERHPYYQEWLRPFGLKWYCGIIISGFEEQWVLSLQRQASGPAYSEAEMKSYSALAAELANVASLSGVLDNVRHRSLIEAFKASNKAVVLVNRLGKVISANHRAESIMAEGALSVAGKELRCANFEAGRSLSTILQAIRFGGLRYQKAIRIPRHDDLPLLATVIPAPDTLENLLMACHAYVVLTDLSEPTKAVAEEIREALGLNLVEGHICAKLAEGHDLRSIAKALSLSYETVRTYIQRIYEKTGTADQVSLAMVIARIG